MTMENKKQIIKKIQALLAKNTDNGATEHEACTALEMATSLMQKYFISENDLKDPLIGEKCKMVEVPLIKSGYDFTIFYCSLANLFDCKYFYNKYRIAFYGFEQDAELCGYFYSLIIRTALREKESYLNSPEAIHLKNYYHGRTISASFINGFLERVCDKMEDLYKEKQSNIPQSYGLMVIEKMKKVEEKFSELSLNIKVVPARLKKIEEMAFSAGSKVGDNFKLTQGIKNYSKDKAPRLEYNNLK